MTCNKNNNGGAVMKMGYSPQQRKLFFYLICIWVRLLIAFSVFKFYNRKELYYLIPIIAVYSVYLNVVQTLKDNKKGKCVWWYRNFHIINALIILVISLFKISLFNIHPNKIISLLLVGDVLFGILTSLIKQPWNN